jgi:hypothetical protein
MFEGIMVIGMGVIGVIIICAAAYGAIANGGMSLEGAWFVVILASIFLFPVAVWWFGWSSPPGGHSISGYCGSGRYQWDC